MASWGSLTINQWSVGVKNILCMEHMTFSFRLQKDKCDAFWEKWDTNLTQRGGYRDYQNYQIISQTCYTSVHGDIVDTVTAYGDPHVSPFAVAVSTVFNSLSTSIIITIIVLNMSVHKNVKNYIYNFLHIYILYIRKINKDNQLIDHLCRQLQIFWCIYNFHFNKLDKYTKQP